MARFEGYIRHLAACLPELVGTGRGKVLGCDDDLCKEDAVSIMARAIAPGRT